MPVFRVEAVTTAPVALLSPHIAGNNFSFSFATTTYESYTVERATDLAAPNWMAYTNVVGNGGTVEVLIPLLPQTNSVTQQFVSVRRP